MKLIRKEYLRETPLSYLCMKHNELCRKCHSFILMCNMIQVKTKWDFWEEIVLLQFKVSDSVYDKWRLML